MLRLFPVLRHQRMGEVELSAVGRKVCGLQGAKGVDVRILDLPQAPRVRPDGRLKGVAGSGR